MKKYLFGLGAMLVGAGLMFVLMHGEVGAKELGDKIDDNGEVRTGQHLGLPYRKLPDRFLCSASQFPNHHYEPKFGVFNCRVDDLICGVTEQGISCVKN